jgi:hypothetical protein
MKFVREWLNSNDMRLERLYEGSNGQHYLWSAPISQDKLTLGDKTIREIAGDELSRWYAVASGDGERSAKGKTYKDSRGH